MINIITIVFFLSLVGLDLHTTIQTCKVQRDALDRRVQYNNDMLAELKNIVDEFEKKDNEFNIKLNKKIEEFENLCKEYSREIKNNGDIKNEK